MLAGKVDSDEVYSKAVLNAILDSKADEANVYSKTATDDLLAAKANAADVYTKAEEDAALALKADAIVDDYTTKATFAAFQTDVNAEFQNRYTKSEDDALLAVKADSSDVYTKAEVDALIGGIKMLPLLDFANPIFTFDATHLSYTADRDCFMFGTLYTSASATGVNTVTVNNTGILKINTSGNVGRSLEMVTPIPLKSGDTVQITLSSGNTYDNTSCVAIYVERS